MSLALDVLDHRLTVEMESAQVERHARTLLVDLVSPAGCDDERVGATGTDPALVLPSLVGTLNLAAIRFGAGRLMPHAGAVARPDGSVALLCGGSGAGKSTLTAALMQRGCAYLTDETAVLDPESLTVLPFRKPLSLKSGAQALYPEVRPVWAGPDDVWLVPSTAFADVPVPAGPLEARVLVFPQYDGDARSVTVREVPPAEAAYLVGAQSSRLRDVTGGPLPALARLARRVPAFQVIYPDAGRAAEEVLQLWPAT